MYGKHFQSTYTGSMIGAGAEVFAVWGYVIAHAVDSTVELNPSLLSYLLGVEVEKVEKAIEYLCKPDATSRNKAEEGRRLVREGQYSYRVVSHDIYRRIRNAADKRESDRERQRKHRLLRDKRDSRDNRDERDSHAVVTNVTKIAHTEAEADTYTEIPPSVPKNGNGSRKSSKKEPDPRHKVFQSLIFRCYQKLNNGENPPWDASEAKQLDLLLKAKPDLSEATMKEWLTNYYYSQDHLPGIRPRTFIPNLSSYTTTANKFRRAEES